MPKLSIENHYIKGGPNLYIIKYYFQSLACLRLKDSYKTKIYKSINNTYEKNPR
jgi:hypothetical protein